MIRSKPLVLLVVLASRAALADAPPTGPSLNTPESPASTIVGASTQGITHAGTAAEAGFSLLNGFDVNGNLKTGVGIEVAPALMFMPYSSHGSWITTDTYRSNPDGFSLTRLAARTSLSLATAKGANTTDQSVAAAAGIRTTLFDAGDPILDTTLADCQKAAALQGISIAEQLQKTYVPPKDFKPGPLPTDDIQLAFVTAGVNKCKSGANNRNWNRSSWNISLADSYVSPTGAVGKLKQQTYQFNTTLAYGFDGFKPMCENLGADDCKTRLGKQSWFPKHSQLVLAIQYQDGALVPDPKKKGMFYQQNAWQFGTQLRMKPWVDPGTGISSKQSNWSATLISLELVYSRATPEALAASNDLQLIFGSELKLGATTFLDFGLGMDRKRTTGTPNKGFALTQFKWNFGSASSGS
jgi:hypothetical protein